MRSTFIVRFLGDGLQAVIVQLCAPSCPHHQPPRYLCRPDEPLRVLEAPLLVKRDRPFVEVDDAELHRYAGAELGERLLHQSTGHALALPFRCDDQLVDLRHRCVLPVEDHEAGKHAIVLGGEDRAVRVVHGFARCAFGDPDDVSAEALAKADEIGRAHV